MVVPVRVRGGVVFLDPKGRRLSRKIITRAEARKRFNEIKRIARGGKLRYLLCVVEQGSDSL